MEGGDEFQRGEVAVLGRPDAALGLDGGVGFEFF